MTECFLSDERLAGYAEDTLSEEDRLGVEGHLAGCARCQQQLEWLRSLAAQTRALPRSMEIGRASCRERV